MTKDRFSIALVGAGFGRLHGAAFQKSPLARVGAVCSRTTERAGELAAEFGVPGYTDVERLIAEQSPDVVCFAVPAGVQATLASIVARRGIAVFLEKPLSPDVETAQNLVAALQEHSVLSAVNFEFAELFTFREAKRLLEQNAIGELRHVVVRWELETYSNRISEASWKTTTSDGGGALNLFGSHVLYYLEWLLGPLSSLSADLSRAPSDARQHDSVDTLSMKTVAGVPIAFQLSTCSFGGGGHSIEFFGENGRLHLYNRGGDHVLGFELALTTRQDAASHVVCRESENPEVVAGEDGRIAPTARIAARLLHALRDRQPMVPSAAEGLRVQRLLDAARLSSQTGTRIELLPGGRPRT